MQVFGKLNKLYSTHCFVKLANDLVQVQWSIKTQIIWSCNIGGIENKFRIRYWNHLAWSQLRKHVGQLADNQPTWVSHPSFWGYAIVGGKTNISWIQAASFISWIGTFYVFDSDFLLLSRKVFKLQIKFLFCMKSCAFYSSFQLLYYTFHYWHQTLA